MRLALSSLILAAGLATTVHAQDPAVQPAPPAAPVAAPAVEPAAVPPAAEAAPAATPEVPAEPAPPPPTLPTTGDAAEVISVIENICIPAVRGQKAVDLAKAHGFKFKRREQTWNKRLGEDNKNYEIIVYPQGSNQTVCMVDLHYEMGKDEEIAKALNVWSFIHEPPLEPTANYTQPQDPDGLKRVRRSWEYLTATDSVGLNFSTVRNPDGSSLSSKYDAATLQYQERKF